MIDDVGDLEAVEAILSAYESESRILRTLGEVAAVLGVKPQTVRAWRMESPPMPGEPGRYLLSEIQAWRETRLKGNAVSGMAELNVESQRAELWRRLESVRGKRLKNDRLENSVILRDELERDIEKAFRLLETKLATLPERVVGVVPEALREAVRETTEDTVAIALREIHERAW